MELGCRARGWGWDAELGCVAGRQGCGLETVWIEHGWVTVIELLSVLMCWGPLALHVLYVGFLLDHTSACHCWTCWSRKGQS